MGTISAVNDVITCSITAVLILEDSVIFGEGTYLHLCDLSTRRHLSKHAIFRTSVIHGIKASSNRLVMFGQKSLRLGHLIDSCFEVTSQVAEFSDWIWDVQWLSNPKEHLAVGLAHNTVALWNCSSWECSQTVCCEENCILYSAHFIGHSWEGLILAAGVVFNEVVIWQPANQKKASGKCAVLSRCKGHEGVIFNIDYNHSKQLICSVSDDRTIRIWSLSLSDVTVGGQPIITLYGHGARVWDAKLMTDVIVSVGEDACCIVWSYNGQILKKFTGHKGQNIWSLAVDEGQNIIVTGGGDSSIRLWPLTSTKQNDHTTEYLDVDESTKAALGLSKDVDGLLPRLVCLLQIEVLVMMQNGSLLGYNIPLKAWRLVLHNEEFRSYCVMQESPDDAVVAIGTICGNIWLHRTCDGACLCHVSVYSSKVLSLCWGSDQDLFSSGPEGSLVWWRVEGEDSSCNLSRFCNFVLPHSRHRWLISVTLLPEDDGFICGDKRGSVFLYQRQGDDMAGCQEPCDRHMVVHGKTGVSFLGQHEGFVYSAGRDGTYCKYAVLEGCRLELLNTFKVFKGFDWLERLVFDSTGIIVVGFHSADFVVYNTSTNETLMKVNCGGGHRSWGLNYSSEGTQLAFIKAKQVVLCATKDLKPGQVILKPHLHGRVIRCILYLGQFNLADGTDCTLIATGSEDTMVNINVFLNYLDRPSQVVPLHRLQGHISSVCSMTSCPSITEPQSVLLFTVGGRMAIHVWRVTLPNESDMESIERDVRVDHLAFSGTVDNAARRRHLRRLRESNIESDPETRFMDVKVRRVDAGESVLLYIAGSDGLIRIYSFHESTKDLSELCHSAPHSCCFLSLLLHEVTLQTNTFHLLFSGGTDGNISTWDVSAKTSRHNFPPNFKKKEFPSANDNSKRLEECRELSTKSKRLTEKISENTTGTEFNPESHFVENFLPQSTAPLNVMDELYLTNQCTSEVAIGELLAEIRNHEMSSSKHDAIVDEGSQRKSSPLYGNLSVSSSTTKSDPPAYQSCGVTMATDNTEMRDVLLTLRCHQSGVNALAMKPLGIGSERVLLASGGDDGAVHVHMLEVEQDETSTLKVKVLSKVSQELAHAAQVTGLRFLNRDWLISISVDQRLMVWKLQGMENNTSEKQMLPISCSFITIPDISCLTFWTNSAGRRYIAVSGQGVQVAHLEAESS